MAGLGLVSGMMLMNNQAKPVANNTTVNNTTSANNTTATNNSKSASSGSSSNNNQQSNPTPNTSPTVTAPKISTSQALSLAEGYAYFSDANYYAEYVQNGNNPYYAVTIYSSINNAYEGAVDVNAITGQEM